MNIALVPARCGSKSIHLKNIKAFCKKPLIYWTLYSLEKSLNIHKIFVATDCDEIKNIVNNFNFTKVIVYDREPQNATDEASTESLMLEFINKHNFNNKDLLLLVQTTSPFTQTKDFDEALRQIKVQNADSLLTCTKVQRFLWSKNGIAQNYDYTKRPRRQDMQRKTFKQQITNQKYNEIFMENGAFYINTIENINKYKNRLSGKICIYEMPEFTSVELDEAQDWFIAQKLMHKYILSKQSMPKIKLFLCDVDGTLTDAGMYYDNKGERLKKFNTHDGKGFELLKKAGIKTGIITSENTKIVSQRAKKLKVDYLYQSKSKENKLKIAKQICQKENISLQNTAYIGDDINCKDLLQNVALCACPNNAMQSIKDIPNIIHLSCKGGEGAAREFIEMILKR